MLLFAIFAPPRRLRPFERRSRFHCCLRPVPVKQRSSKRLSWDERFEKLVEFYRNAGHTSISRTFDPTLHAWCLKQRSAWKRGDLSLERYRLLSALDFAWDAQFARWKEHFYELAAYSVQHGNCNVPYTHDNTALGRWVLKQRYLFRRGRLCDERKRRLLGIGFSFNPDADTFARNIEALRKWKQEHGNLLIPRRLPLGRWADAVRQRKRQGKLKVGAYRELRELGFCFEPQIETWTAWLERLDEFRKERGHVTPSFITERPLYEWLQNQRRRYRTETLDDEHRMQLESMGVDLRPKQVAFEGQLCKLEQVWFETGHAIPPVENIALRMWVAYVRDVGRNKLSRNCAARLEKIGFRFDGEASSKQKMAFTQ